jgi:hypothetical protein
MRRDPWYDFGAVHSLRERLAVGEHMHSNTWDDALRTCYVVQLELVRALAEYLDARDIDSTGFREEAKALINGYRAHVQKQSALDLPFVSRTRTDGVDLTRKSPKSRPRTPPTPAPRPRPEEVRPVDAATTRNQ